MKNIDQLISEQVQTWSHREAKARRKGEAPGAWPIITISREFGAHGTALAVVLGRRIGFKVWDKDLLSAIAEEGGADERFLTSLDERRRRMIDDALHGSLMGTKHTNTHYFRSLLRVVHTIGAHGKSIVVGRGGNYIIKSPIVLRVRVVCPFEERVRGYAYREGLTEKEAQKRVKTRDSDRDDFIRHHFKHDRGQSSDYDLVLNSGVFSLEEMADIILLAYETKVGKKVPLIE